MHLYDFSETDFACFIPKVDQGFDGSIEPGGCTQLVGL